MKICSPEVPLAQQLLKNLRANIEMVPPFYHAFVAGAERLLENADVRQFVAELEAQVLRQAWLSHGAYHTPLEACPYCGAMCDADWVDVGVGLVQAGPYHCQNCHASEAGPYDTPREQPDLNKAALEAQFGWYAPNSPPGSSANTFMGQIIGHQEAKALYQAFYPAAVPK